MTDQQKAEVRVFEAKLKALVAHMHRPEPPGGFTRRDVAAMKVHKLMIAGCGPEAAATRAGVSLEMVEDQWRAWLTGYSDASPEWRNHVNNQLRKRLKKGESEETIQAAMGVSSAKIRAEMGKG